MIIVYLRWTVRTITCLILVFWFFMLFAHIFGSNVYNNTIPIDFSSIAYLSLVGVSILGFAISWKWELFGGILTISVYILNVIINPKILIIVPHYVLPLFGLVFIIIWLIDRKKK